MKKSELYARYMEFNNNLVEISREEFFNAFTIAEPENVTHHSDGKTDWTEIWTDGMTYMMFTSWWNVGWQGDVDGDTFFCKKKTITKAEMEEISKIFA